MGNEFKAASLHSSEYFGDTRDYWWNADFLELMASRWDLDRVREVLDVGSGMGHWGRALSSVLPEAARIIGVDRETTWVQKANEFARLRGVADRLEYMQGAVEALPFADNTFDCVTCQTVLIHAPDPSAALAEMIRVTKPGGLVVVVEPNNLAGALLSSDSSASPIDEVVALVRFQLVCERGKAALGEGNNSVAELVPGLFSTRGLRDVQVFMSDKANLLLSPYQSPEQRAFLDEMQEFQRRDFWIWSRLETHRYFVAGGGSESDFERAWSLAASRRAAAGAAVATGSFASAGGTVCYLVSGRKPAQ